MDNLSNVISFAYTFLNEKKAISNKYKEDVSKILSIEATFSIRINGELYFETELAILEFYKTLWEWKELISTNNVSELHYYSIEHADYENGSILSLLPFSDSTKIDSIWGAKTLPNVFDSIYIMNEFVLLEKNLKRDIESYFNIQLERFIKHIPFQKS